MGEIDGQRSRDSQVIQSVYAERKPIGGWPGRSAALRGVRCVAMRCFDNRAVVVEGTERHGRVAGQRDLSWV